MKIMRYNKKINDRPGYKVTVRKHIQEKTMTYLHSLFNMFLLSKMDESVIKTQDAQ